MFIDEIDAIGQSRGGAVRLVGANDEREQTLNQLLAEIDGFKADVEDPVIIMAATNRPEVLDSALMRAGRFDRQVVLGNPPGGPAPDSEDSQSGPRAATPPG